MMNSSLRLLLVEDNMDIAKNIATNFEHLGITLDYADTGVRGLELALNNFYDVIVLDLMLPGMDGLSVCTAIREKADRHIPILMLTARDTLHDKLVGFEKGADDYLTKPFALEELTVRCQALSQRSQLTKSHTFNLGTLSIDKSQKKVSRNNTTINLNSIPFEILMVLADAYPRVVSRSELCERIWGDDLTDSDSLRSHIYQLRKLIDKPFVKPMIKTVHSVGFVLESDE